MMLNPRIGQRVQVWYRAGLREGMPLHGKIGTVEIRGRGRPRNHRILIEGTPQIIPCGNLRKENDLGL